MIWVVSINNPPANTLSRVLLEELGVIASQFENDDKAGILILTGTGDRTFSAGADINEIMTIDSPEKGAALAKLGQDLCDKIEKMDKPVIAAINALCLGGGNEIAMSCHIRIAAENAKFGQPEINIGIIPGFGGTQRLSRLVGVSQARKLILTGDTITTQEAFHLGLVDEIVGKGQVIEQSIILAKRILKNSTLGIKLSMRAIREGSDKEMAEGMKAELECFRKICESEDMKEGLRAFKEKRPPNFKGR